MASFSIADFFVGLSYKTDDASRVKVERSYAQLEKAVTLAEARMALAKEAGAKASIQLGLRKEADLARQALAEKKAADATVTEEARKAKALEQGATKFSTHSQAFVRGMTAMTMAAGVAGLAITAAVVKVSQAFDTLYFTSQRTGASVANIKGLSYAFSQVGSTSGSAVGAIESFAKAMRTNPGIGGFVRSLGVATQEGGKARDTLDVLSDSVDAITAKHPYYTGAQMGEILGLSEEQFQTFSQHREEIKAFRAEYDSMAKGVGLNSQEAAASGEKLQQSFRRIGAAVGVLGQKLLITLAPAIEQVATDLTNWVKNNPDKVDAILKSLIGTVERLGTALKDFVAGFGGEEGAQRLDAWATAMNNLATGMKGVWQVISWIQDSAFWKALTYFESPLWKFLKYAGGQAVGSAQASTGVPSGPRGGYNPATDAAPAGTAPKDERSFWQKIAPKALGGKDAPTAGDGSRSWRNNNPGNLKYGDFAKRMGATSEDDKGFAKFPDYATGRKAQENLLFNDDRYKNLSIREAIANTNPH